MTRCLTAHSNSGEETIHHKADIKREQGIQAKTFFVVHYYFAVKFIIVTWESVGIYFPLKQPQVVSRGTAVVDN